MASPVSSFSLAEFVKSHELPKTVVVTRGYSCGEADEEESLSNGELITLHSVQQSQVVQAKDHLNRAVTLPVVGARKYELLPDESRLDGVIYETVKDIINDDSKPKKVRVTAAVDTGDDESSIYADDILETVNVEGRSGMQPDQRILVAKNQLGEKLRLPLSTPGKFSPQLDVKWYSMAEIINLGIFPQRVHLVSTHTGHRHRGHDKYVLLKTELETSVLITVNKELLALPLSAEIEVALHEVDDQLPGSGVESAGQSAPSAVVVKESANIAKSVTTSNSKPFSTNPFLAEMTADSDESGLSSPQGSIQEDLFSLSKEHRMKVKSGTVRRFGSSGHQPGSTDIESDAPEQVVEIYERLQDKMAESIRLREDANKWRSRCQRLESQHDSNKKQLQKMQRMAEFWRGRVEDIQVVDDNVLQLMRDYVSNPVLVMADMPPPQVRPKDVKADIRKKGVAVLPTVAPSKPALAAVTADKLSIADVQRLLTALNLQQYSKAFLDEQVDGGLLLELDDNSLQNDLGMKSSLHRKKLLRTMQGKGTPLGELLVK